MKYFTQMCYDLHIRIFAGIEFEEIWLFMVISFYNENSAKLSKCFNSFLLFVVAGHMLFYSIPLYEGGGGGINSVSVGQSAAATGLTFVVIGRARCSCLVVVS